MTFEHTAVMPEAVERYLNLQPGGICVDCTLGGSGHAKQCIDSVLPGGRLIGIDRDIDAIIHAEKVLQKFMENVSLVHDNFSKLPDILDSVGIDSADGILLDLGLSLNQLKNSGRGFSFHTDEPLDMRMDTREGLKAMDIINRYEKKDLADLFFKFGEERLSRRIAEKIVTEREKAPVKTSRKLGEIVKQAVPGKLAARQRIHPATRVFQALRIAVNKELEMLEDLMDRLPESLNPGGRFVAISFHSLEDRIIKNKIKEFENGCRCPGAFPQCVCGFEKKLISVVKKPVIPSKKEIAGNPMARSAKMRVAERI